MSQLVGLLGAGFECTIEAILSCALPRDQSLAESSLEECVANVEQRFENDSRPGEKDVFKNQVERKAFIRSAIFVLSENGTRNMRGSQIDIYYNRVREEYRATLAVMKGGQVRSAIACHDLASDERGAFIKLRHQIEALFDALLQRKAGEVSTNPRPREPSTTQPPSQQASPTPATLNGPPTQLYRPVPALVNAPNRNSQQRDSMNFSRPGSRQRHAQQPQDFRRHSTHNGPSSSSRPQSMTFGSSPPTPHWPMQMQMQVPMPQRPPPIAGPTRSRASSYHNTPALPERAWDVALPTTPQQYVSQQQQMAMAMPSRGQSRHSQHSQHSQRGIPRRATYTSTYTRQKHEMTISGVNQMEYHALEALRRGAVEQDQSSTREERCSSDGNV